MEANNSRRNFISKAAVIAGGQVLLAKPLLSMTPFVSGFNESFTVGQVMDKFISEVPSGILKETVDTLKSGHKEMEVKGIVTSAFATVEVIKKTIEIGANFIIAHEPTFYNHLDDTAWLKNDSVFEYKNGLLQKNSIAVWRNHDYIHRLSPDPVTSSFLEKLNWKQYTTKAIPSLATLPSMHLEQVIAYLKEKIGIQQVRYIGDLQQDCSKLLFMLGAVGSKAHFTGLRQIKPDVLICGEISEWETAEYIERENIPITDLYFDQGKGKRYRSLGCFPCTTPVDSTAKNVADIVKELREGKFKNIAERSGRAQDKEDGGGLETLRKEGYM